jgi:hypothetical protein
MTNDTLEQDICSSCRVVKGVRYFAREDVWHCEDCQAYDPDTVNCPVCGVDYIDTMAEPGKQEACTDCLVDLVPCPNHEGAYDCTPFCEICEGEQHYEGNDND